MSVNEYDIDNYSDEECFEMLGLNNPSDRELEMKILDFMDKYEEKSKRLYKFFESMYDRFFSEGEEPEDEDTFVEGLQNMQIIQNPQISTDPRLKTVSETPGTISTSIIQTNNVDYVKDKLKLNPVERKTIMKMISIDSQFREDPGNTLATNFTMNLSESIDNVISMKLYSVQIPYTWYTINKTFGSNFFYIKGNSPGINNGDHDVKVDILSGTYEPAEIVSRINDKFDFLRSVRNNSVNKKNPLYASAVDLSFGNTKISYQLAANDSKIVFEFDLNKKFNETDYQLYFPYWSTPYDEVDKGLSIPSFLGYRYQSYYPYVAYSIRNILPQIGDVPSANATLYTIETGDNSNNYFTIYQYIGNSYNTASSIINKIPIQLSLLNGTYSRNTIYSDVSAQLAKNILLDQNMTYIRRVNSGPDPLNPNAPDLLNSHFEIAIKLNRAEISQTDNSKLAIVFPNESNIGGKHIWTGTDSCFVFKDVNIIELNEVVSETETLLTNYIITSDTKISINCIKPFYDVSENIRTATVATSLSSGFVNGYLFNNYLDAINNSLIEMNNQTIIPTYKPNGEFNINTGSSQYGTGISIKNDRANFQFDIAREFDQSTYIVDLSSCFLSKSPFFFDASISDLTLSNFTVSISFSTTPNITINNTNNKLVLIPKKTGGPYGYGYGNQNAPSIELYFTETTYSILDNLIRGINNDFLSFVDSDGYSIMTASNISFANSQLTLQLKISKIISEIDYRVRFIDDSINNSWANYLFMDASYNLSENMVESITHAELVGNGRVSNNTITLSSLNNTFSFRPYTNGVADITGANDISFTLPLTNGQPTIYTREGLILAIQTLFDANSLANGSKITLVNESNLQYANIRMNINKTYYSKDFKLVFYDLVSFVYCNIGVTQNATWDSTLGWLLGFHSFTEYVLGDFININEDNISSSNYGNNVFNQSSSTYNYIYSYDSTTKKIAIIGDVVLTTNLYNYFLVVLDDFIQNHVNAGLITITSLENDISLPSYASRVTYQCDPVTGIKTAVSASNKLNTELSAKQLYAMNQIIENRRTKSKSYASGPYMKDVFALIPIKLAGLKTNQTYSEFGGTVQNNDRKYYGPVRIQKLSIKLMNDKGQIVDLNGANFSITIICEILNKNT